MKASAKQRLLALVEPALAALDKVLRDKSADDNTKMRAAVAILDRTGFRPGVVVEVKEHDPWSDMLNSAVDLEDDRSLGGGGVDQPGELDNGHRDQLALDLTNDNWREIENADAREYEAGRIRPDENTVRGEVVEPSPIRFDVDQAPSTSDSEFGGTGAGRYDPPAKTRIEQIQEDLIEQDRANRRGRP